MKRTSWVQRFFFAVPLFCVGVLAVPAIAQEAANPVPSKNMGDALIAQGPIGIVCLILISASLLVYRDGRTDKKEREAVVDKLREDNVKLQEEHAKAIGVRDEKWMALSLEYAKDRAQSTLAIERFLRYIERVENKS